MKVMLIDDEPLATEVIIEYLKEFPDFSVCGVCHHAFDGLKQIKAEQPDLLFLDIQMPKINGFEMLELLEEKPAVIFVTAFDEYAIKAFEVHAADYLLKPVSRERFRDAINSLLNSGFAANRERLERLDKEESARRKDRILVRSGNDIIVLPFTEICYLEAYDDYVKIYHEGNRYLKKSTLQHYESLVSDSSFIRVHRSYLVNVAFIDKLEHTGRDSYQCVLKDGAVVSVSRSGYSRLREALGS